MHVTVVVSSLYLHLGLPPVYAPVLGRGRLLGGPDLPKSLRMGMGKQGTLCTPLGGDQPPLGIGVEF